MAFLNMNITKESTREPLQDIIKVNMLHIIIAQTTLYDLHNHGWFKAMDKKYHITDKNTTWPSFFSTKFYSKYFDLFIYILKIKFNLRRRPKSMNFNQLS